MNKQRTISGAVTVASIAAAIVATALLVRWAARQDLITLVMGGSAGAALLLLGVVLRRARAAGELDSSALLVFAAGLLPNLAIFVVVISGGVVRELDISRELVPMLPGWYSNAVYMCLGVLIAIAAALLCARLVSLRRLAPLHAGVLIAILLWALTWLASGLYGGSVVSLSGVALFACLAAAAVLPRGRGACVGAATFGVVLAIGSGILAAVNFGLAAVPCRDDCILGDALTGLFPNENLLAPALVVSLPFIYLGFRGRIRIALLLYVAATAIATASRGAIVASIIVVAALLVLRPSLDEDRVRPIRTALAALFLIGALAGVVYVVAHQWSPTSTVNLDDRPLLWNVAERYIADSPLFGYGPNKWETLYTQTGEIPLTAQHSTHNQLMDVLFRAGWVGVLLLVAMMLTLLRSAGAARRALLIVLATAFAIGITERTWAIGVVDFITFSFLATLLLGPTTAQAPGRAGAEQGAEALGVDHRPRVPVPAG